MPRTKSAKKALRQNVRRHQKNLQKKSELKEILKTFKRLVAEKKTKEAEKYLPQVYKALDKAAKTHVVKKGGANRLKAKFSRKLSSNK